MFGEDRTPNQTYVICMSFIGAGVVDKGRL